MLVDAAAAASRRASAARGEGVGGMDEVELVGKLEGSNLMHRWRCELGEGRGWWKGEEEAEGLGAACFSAEAWRGAARCSERGRRVARLQQGGEGEGEAVRSPRPARRSCPRRRRSSLVSSTASYRLPH